MNNYQKLDWISFAIQEAINGNKGELMQALNFVEELRDPRPEEMETPKAMDKCIKTRKVQLKVTRTETWFPVYEVPAEMNDFEAETHVNAEAPDEVFDEYNHKYTLDTETYCEVLEHFLQ
tara:strand:- start:434 stop:793 length:360 start_codon:yes stop_codon:yes gene_type:complete